MIVRILGEGQWTIEGDSMEELNRADSAVQVALANDDSEVLAEALEHLIAKIKQVGTIVPDDVLAESDLILPYSTATTEEVRALLEDQTGDDGLIPG